MEGYANMLIFRWIAFLIAFVSVYILITPNTQWQWLGWLIGSVSCLMWIKFAFKDQDWARFCMELMYFVLAIWGVINWYGY